MISRILNTFLFFLILAHYRAPTSQCNALSSQSFRHYSEGNSHLAPVPSPSVKTIKTPTGTVKCSCQTVTDEDSDVPVEYQDDKTIEIEIHTPSENEDGDDDDSSDENQHQQLKHKMPHTKNSFTLDDDETAQVSENYEDSQRYSSNDRFFSTEEPPPFSSFLSMMASQMQDNSQENFASNEPASLRLDLRSGGTHSHHRFETEGEVEADTEAPNLYNVYKAYRSSELSESPLGGSDFELSHLKNTKSTSTFVRDRDPEFGDPEGEVKPMESNSYFLWDFMYSGSGSARPPISSNMGKKRDFLYLGSMIDSFKGPRRRRKRSLRGNNKQPSPVFFVYPEGYKAPSEKQEGTVLAKLSSVQNQNSTNINSNKVQQLHQRSEPEAGVVIDKQEIQEAMQAAMDRAWAEYGPNGVHAVRPSIPAVVVADQASRPPPPITVTTVAKAQPNNLYRPQQQVQSYYYTPPRPFLYIDRIFNPFQPMSSEWDKHIDRQGPPPPPPEPGLFSRFLARYIDFEVNNHEAADLMRRVVFGIFVGFLVIGWIGLGVLLGIIPLKKWLALMSGASTGTKRIDKGKELTTRDATISELTDKILLSLDADWLKRLEERVMDTGGKNIRKLPTQVFCCVLPEEQAKGMVECQVRTNYKKGNKTSGPFKCISDLFYNFQFGPKDDSTGDEIDNRVNINGEGQNQNNNRNKSESGNEPVTISYERK